MAVLGPCANVNMNGHNNIQNQLSKSLERILEDAYLSGELKLSGRKLSDFPRTLKYDLSDTVFADLSKNRFVDFPDEVTSYIFLEKLLLSQNTIRNLPDAVGGLQSLTFLDLSSNQLTELPREICQMPLQVLLLSDNCLTSLPKEVGKMGTLAELDASHNRLTQVPMTMGDCVGLRVLDLSNNQLGLLPLQITYLHLEHLDVSSNCISSLPLELRNMSTLVTLRLENNPLVSPPITVCMRGRVHIFKYLDNMANKEAMPHKRVEDTRRAAKHSSFLGTTAQGHQITSGNATIDCLRHRPRPVVDSGYSTDGVDKRWSNDAAGEAGGGGSGRSTPSTPSTLSPGAALSRQQSLSSDTPLAPLTPLLSGVRISPEGGMNGDDKNKLNQQTYRQYKEALRQQRTQDVYRPRTDQSSPEVDSSPQHSPIHLPKSQSSPHSPLSNGHTSNNSSLYKNSISTSISTPNTSQVPNSPLLHSTPRRNGEILKEENKRPVQKVVPSRNVNKIYPTNGTIEYQNGQNAYTKPTSPTKSPTQTYNIRNGEPKLLTTSYVKGVAPKPPAAKMSWNKDIAAEKLSFTMKREFDKQKEELDLLQQLRTIIESRLKMQLPTNMSAALADGVVLCHLANHVRPRAVASVHVPSPAQPKLTMARCRRNVDNFIEACRRIGVEEESLCAPDDVTGGPGDGEGEGGDLLSLARCVIALAHATPRPDQSEPCNIYDQSDDSSPRDDQSKQCTDQTTLNCDQSQVTKRVETEYFPENPLFCHVSYKSYSRYTEERYVSNFNYNVHTIDESEELLYDHNNDDARYSPVYTSELKNRGPYFQKNKVQFVTPFCKANGVLQSDSLEIYDTDEVDFPVEIPEDQTNQRYDKTKMSLDIKNNLNQEVQTETDEQRDNRQVVTCLCLGAFFLSFIILYLYPL